MINTLSTSGLETSQVDAVVKTGGSSNIPMFTYMLESIFGKEKVVAADVFNSVTAGLAIKANQDS